MLDIAGTSLSAWIQRQHSQTDNIHIELDFYTGKNKKVKATLKATLKNFRFSLIIVAPVDKSGSVLPEGRLHFP